MPGRSRKRGQHGPPPPPSAAAARRPAPLPERREPSPDSPAASASPDSPAASASASPEPPPVGTGVRREPVRDTQSPPAHLPRESRSEARNAEIRAALRPYAAGERPPIVITAAAIAAALALANFISWLAGLKISGHHPGAVGILLFTAVLLACATGLWQMRAGAVLGFMTLMAIIAVLFTLFLIEASNVLGAVVALAIIVVTGYLFFKLVRVLSRLQMPREGETASKY